MKKYIVLSVNENPDYLFHLPIVNWAWQQFGWWPIVFYAGKMTTLADYVFRFCFEEYDGSFVHQLDIKPYKSSTIAQVSRLYASNFYWMDQDSYIMTGDVDMCPLSNYWKPDFNKLTVWGRDLTDYHYPMCYIGMKAAFWTDIMDGGAAHPRFFIQRDLDALSKVEWTTDQDMITEKINNSIYVPERIDRGTDRRTGYPIGRIDRSHWILDHRQFIDCHMFHGIQNDESKFKKTLEMLHTVWPQEDFKWWINYVKEFKKICQK